MIESIPETVDSAFLYFHTHRSTGDELTSFLPELQRKLPQTYLRAGDGPIEGKNDDPIMGRATTYGTSRERFWFVFPMQSSTKEAFVAATEAMGAVLLTCGSYINLLADEVMNRFHLPASRVVLCGHQHGACAALAAAMLRREDPFGLTILFDPWQLETLYLQKERDLPHTQVVCIDNEWARERERQRGANVPLYQIFQDYGMNAEGITLPQGEGKPDEFMFREAARQVKNLFRRS